MEIIDLIANQASSEDIAGRLGISINTVKNHRKNILAKLGCSNSPQMISLARLYGLLSAENVLNCSAA